MKKLFHGTKSENISKINAQGFNRSFGGKNATVYGRGVYFAVNALYSSNDEYSCPDPFNSHKHMYLCYVLTGVSTPVEKDEKRPEPPPKRNGSAELYDSVTDPDGNMYVVFNDAQAYPAYLITFKSKQV